MIIQDIDSDELVEGEDGRVISFFYFECKFCKERWFSTFCYCPRCKRVRKFKILSEEELNAHLMENFLSSFANQIHYVLMREEEEK